MLGSLSSRLGLARLPSTFQAAAATLLPSSLFSTSSFAMADSGGRWWSDRIANKKRRRLGYHDKVKQEGPLPRVRDDSARIKQAGSYKPSNPWSPSKALAGQNDYIDILGSEELHPKHLLYHVPNYLKGVHKAEKHFQIQLRRHKALEHTKFPDAFPSKWQGWRLTMAQNHRWLNRRMDQNWWVNYQGIKEGPVKNPFKPRLF